jgi:hypothetical protein
MYMYLHWNLKLHVLRTTYSERCTLDTLMDWYCRILTHCFWPRITRFTWLRYWTSEVVTGSQGMLVPLEYLLLVKLNMNRYNTGIDLLQTIHLHSYEIGRFMTSWQRARPTNIILFSLFLFLPFLPVNKVRFWGTVDLFWRQIFYLNTCINLYFRKGIY